MFFCVWHITFECNKGMGLTPFSSPGYGLKMGFVADVYPIWVYFYVFVILPGLLSMQ